MSVRLRLALTILFTGLASALGVIVTVAIAFQRFEHQTTWERADAFLNRVVALHPDLLLQRERDARAFNDFLRNLLLYEPNTQLYLLDMQGTVLASTGRARHAPGYKVALSPVQQAADAAARGDRASAAYVMGDDPEYMDADAVVAARALRHQPRGATVASASATTSAAGYLYLVARQPGRGGPPGSRLELLTSSLATPALAAVLAVIGLTTALAAWIISAVTRPLRVLSDEVAAAARQGFDGAALEQSNAAAAASPIQPPPTPTPQAATVDDEFGRLRIGFHALLATLRMQWDRLRRLDHFRRESVSNLSHDLRSPLTATVACLETLEQRWQHDVTRADDRQLVTVALRNTRNAAALVRSLGDLALLDEPAFQLHPMRVDLGEVLDDIALRFAARATSQGVALRFEQRGSEPQVAQVDIELFERAVANLLDNALKHTPAGRAVVLSGERVGERVRVCVADEGSGIAAEDLPQLFDRLYQSRSGVAPASSDEGKGLGLAIVKRIVELHRGTVAVISTLGLGDDGGRWSCRAARRQQPAPVRKGSATVAPPFTARGCRPVWTLRSGAVR